MHLCTVILWERFRATIHVSQRAGATQVGYALRTCGKLGRRARGTRQRVRGYAVRTVAQPTTFAMLPVAALRPIDKLLNSRPEAIDTSLACIRDEDALWADKVRAATAILDRAGMPAGLKLEVERSSDLKPAVLTLMQNPPVVHGETLDAVQVITTLPPTAPAALEPLPLPLANRKASARTRKASEQATH